MMIQFIGGKNNQETVFFMTNKTNDNNIGSVGDIVRKNSRIKMNP